MDLPDLITHDHSRPDRPFRNLGDPGPDQLANVPRTLKQRKAGTPGCKRELGKKVTDFRRRTETELRDLFPAPGGKPETQ